MPSQYPTLSAQPESILSILGDADIERGAVQNTNPKTGDMHDVPLDGRQVGDTTTTSPLLAGLEGTEVQQSRKGCWNRVATAYGFTAGAGVVTAVASSVMLITSVMKGDHEIARVSGITLGAALAMTVLGGCGVVGAVRRVNGI